MADESHFLSQFFYEFISTDDIKKNTKLAKNSSNKQRTERATEMTIYFGGSSGQYVRPEFENRPEIDFCSGSSYLGEWNQFGMCGKGYFTFPNGVRYQGTLHEGSFDGKGKLIYPNGVQIHGVWSNGKSKKNILLFSDGLRFKKRNWKFCQYPDRRYVACVENGIPAVGQSYITPTKPARIIPKGCYDTVDGIFNPKLKIVYNPETRRIIRIPTTKECEWIIKHCRCGTLDEIPDFRKPVHVETNYSFDEIRLKGLSECSSAYKSSSKKF